MQPEDLFNKDLPLSAKYRRNGWPASIRPDRKEPSGWEAAMTAGACIPHHIAPSPDGDRIAFVWNVNDQSDLYLLGAEGGWPRRLTFGRGLAAPWNDSSPEWSPDGTRLAFSQKGGVWTVPAAGGTPKRLTDPALTAGSPRWGASSHMSGGRESTSYGPARWCRRCIPATSCSTPTPTTRRSGR